MEIWSRYFHRKRLKMQRRWRVIICHSGKNNRNLQAATDRCVQQMNKTFPGNKKKE